jgi:LPXTG-motif cell wall-anchored protein
MKALAIALIAIGFLVLARAAFSRLGSLVWSTDSDIVGVPVEPTVPVWALGLLGALLVGVGVFLLWRRRR